MKVFLSHPMNGLSESEIMSIRDSAYTYLQAVYGNIKIIDNLHLYEAPKGAGRLWHLGRSIQQLEEADAIYFCGDWEDARGCCVEEMAARYYGLKVLE